MSKESVVLVGAPLKLSDKGNQGAAPKTPVVKIRKLGSQDAPSTAPPPAGKKGKMAETEAAMMPTPSDDAWRAPLLMAIGQLRNRSDAEPFNSPVDHVGLGLVGYTTIVKKPMDLGTIESRLLTDVARSAGERAHYTSEKAVLKDIALVFENCRAYNVPDSPIYNTSMKLESAFEKMLDKAKTKAASARGAAGPGPAGAGSSGGQLKLKIRR